MRFSPAYIDGMQMWRAKQGNWSFLIVKDEVGFVCSYKNMQLPNLSTIFKGKSEFYPKHIGDKASPYYYFSELRVAMHDCRAKYKELLLR